MGNNGVRHVLQSNRFTASQGLSGCPISAISNSSGPMTKTRSWMLCSCYRTKFPDPDFTDFGLADPLTVLFGLNRIRSIVSFGLVDLQQLAFTFQLVGLTPKKQSPHIFERPDRIIEHYQDWNAMTVMHQWPSNHGHPLSPLIRSFLGTE